MSKADKAPILLRLNHGLWEKRMNRSFGGHAKEEYLASFEGERLASILRRVSVRRIAPAIWAIFCDLLALSGAIIGGTPSAATAERPTTTEVFRIARAGNPIVLPVTIGEKTCNLLFDTGTTTTAVDVSLMSLLGPPTRVDRIDTSVAAEPIEVTFYKAPRLCLGRRPLGGVAEMSCLDLRKDGLAELVGIDGLLGMDALKGMIVQIDFDRGELSLLPAVPEDAGEAVTMDVVAGHPYVAVLAEGEQVKYLFAPPPRFLLDTGAIGRGSGAMKKDLFGLLCHSGVLYDTRDTLCVTLAGEMTTRSARVPVVRLAPFEHRGLIFAEGRSNLLSLSYLSRYRVILDFRENRLFLSAGARYAEPDWHDLSGISFEMTNREALITDVDKPSAASAAGLRPGDAIREIDGVRASSLSATDVQRILSTPAVRSLMVRRGYTVTRLRLVLAGTIPKPPPPRNYVLGPDKRLHPVGDDGDEAARCKCGEKMYVNPLIEDK